MLFLLGGLFFISGFKVILNSYEDSCPYIPQYMFGKYSLMMEAFKANDLA